MAVPKRKTSKARRDSRRSSHWKAVHARYCGMPPVPPAQACPQGMQEVRLLRWQASHRSGCKRKEEPVLTPCAPSSPGETCGVLCTAVAYTAPWAFKVVEKGRECIVFCLLSYLKISLYFFKMKQFSYALFSLPYSGGKRSWHSKKGDHNEYSG